jgi:hypothetical protein
MWFSPSTPAWARELVVRVCNEAGVPGPRRVSWRARRDANSTGTTRHHDGVIGVRAGRAVADQRLTLLHELAHWIAPAPRRRRRGVRHHGRAFYTVAFDLYARHGISVEVALWGEGGRYPSSLRHAAALGVAGAAEALAARQASRRDALRTRPRGRWRVAVAEHVVTLTREGRWTVCATCRQRIVGPNLARLRRARRPARHVLLTRGPAEPTR